MRVPQSGVTPAGSTSIGMANSTRPFASVEVSSMLDEVRSAVSVIPRSIAIGNASPPV